MDATSFTSSDLGAEAVVVALAGAGFDIGGPATVTRTLLDTFDGRLHAAGLRLELRRAGAPELVLTGGGAAAARLAVAEAPRLATDLPPGPFRSRLAPVLDVRAMVQVLTITALVRTAVRRDRTGKTRVVVAVQDRLALEGATATTPAWTADVDGLTGYPKDAARARELLVSLGLHSHAGDVVDAVAAASGTDLAGFKGSPTVPLGPGEQALAGFRRVLANLAVAVDANWAGTVDDVDPEFLHDLRVAVRRTRSVLSQAKRVVPGDVRQRYRDGFGWVGAVTGPARDLDVYVIEWDEYVSDLAPGAAVALGPVLDHIDSRRSAEHVRLAKHLRSARYRSLMTDWRAWLAAAADGPGRDAARDIGSVAANRIGRAQRQLLARGRAITPATAAEELHELRKDAKKLRYLLECLGGLYAPSPRKAFVQRLKALQDNLGEHQDTEVHVAQLRAFSHELHGSVGPDTLVAMGQLTEHLETRRRAARAEFAQRFAAYDTTKTAAALDALLRSEGGG